MKAGIAIALLVGLVLIPASASASDRPGPPWDFEFSYASPTGGLTDIPDDSVRWYTLDLDYGDPAATIQYLELEIDGLSHTRPEDINIILLDPLGQGIEVQDDAGDGYSLSDITVQYSDFTDVLGGKLAGLPHGVGEGSILDSNDSGVIYLPDGPEAFTDYSGMPVGSAPWILVMIDDSVGDSGSFQSVSLHGIVPEPMTLSLLALGAFVTIRRRR